MAVATPLEAPLSPLDFQRAARTALTQTPAGVDPWFHGYHGDLLDDRGYNTWLRAKAQLLALIGGAKGRVVVDAGSGFGMVSNLLASWGARRVWAAEVHTPMVESHRKVLDAHFGAIRDRVHPVRTDVSALPIARASADVVLSIEAISHYYDVERFFDECARVLRPGGFVVISDGNNGANPRIRQHTEELWQRLEAGPTGILGDHEIPEPMVLRRQRVLRGAFPQLGEARVATLAAATSGYDAERIVREVGAYLREAAPAPASPYRRGDCPREPVWGYWLERLFDPRELCQMLERRGFRAYALPHYGGAKNDLVHLMNVALRQVPSFRFARAYRVVARRV
jgi:SAM-dependent methyltransferase